MERTMIKLNSKLIIRFLIFFLFFLFGFKNIENNEFSIEIINLKKIEKICVLFDDGNLIRYSINNSKAKISIKNEKKPVKLFVYFKNKYIVGEVVYDENNRCILEQVIIKKIDTVECSIKYMFKTNFVIFRSAQLVKMQKRCLASELCN